MTTKTIIMMYTNNSMDYNNMTNATGGVNETFSNVSALCAGNSTVGTDHTFKVFKIVIDVFVVGLLCLMGFVGNALSIAVLYRDHDRKNTTNWLLQTLAVTDTLYLLACVFIQTIKTIHEHTEWIPGLKEAFPYIQPFMWVFASTAQTITIWTVMLVTIDRFIAICKPLSTNLRSVKRAKITVFCIIVGAVAYNIPRIFEREIVYDECVGRVVSKRTAFRSNKVYFLVYKTICYFIFRAIGPLVTLIWLNLKLIQALQEVRRKHKDLNKSAKNRENITLMLVVVVTVFIVCTIPDLTLRILVTVKNFSDSNLNMATLKYVNTISNMLLTVNSSINFLVYCLIGKKFRRILRTMCCNKQRSSGPDISETEPLTCRTQITKNGTSLKGADVTL